MTDLSNEQAAEALCKVIGESGWEAVAIAKGYLALLQYQNDEKAARAIYENGPQTLKKSKELVEKLKVQSFLSLLSPRKRIGSAENPITKLFPAAVTEQRFLEFLEELCIDRAGIEYSDQRESGHTLVDFAVHEGDRELPINVKNAGTRFERAEQLVGLNPDDCLPIPAYKAHAALEMVPNLVYVISVDYGLVDNLGNLLPRIFSHEERIVWRLLNSYSGTRVRRAEDAFIFSTVRKYWENLKGIAQDNPFHVISARKAVRILSTQPRRTPGIGIRAWGTGARAELNVHVSIKEDTTPWSVVRERIRVKGVEDIIAAVNRRRVEEVYDPEI